MRYIILKDNISLEEIRSRQEYLNDVFKVYTIPFYHKNYVELKSIPEYYGNTIFINGHNNRVYHFLLNQTPKEYNFVLITCYFGVVKKLNFKDKAVFFTDIITDRLNGKEYGFDFEITDSEINLYNCPYSSVEDKIRYSFERIN